MCGVHRGQVQQRLVDVEHLHTAHRRPPGLAERCLVEVRRPGVDQRSVDADDGSDPPGGSVRRRRRGAAPPASGAGCRRGPAPRLDCRASMAGYCRRVAALSRSQAPALLEHRIDRIHTQSLPYRAPRGSRCHQAMTSSSSARDAGSPTAMLLARAGHRVLLVDRASFPSDTMSTHLIHPPGVAALDRWGLLDRLASSGCPPIATYQIAFGPFTVTAAPKPAGAVSRGYAPRRTVLDKLLVDAAVAYGAELREWFTVSEVLIEDGTVTGIRGHAKDGAPVTERARLVVGADGLHSSVARAVQAATYHEQPTLEASYYAYWRDLPADGFEGYIRSERSWAAFPTHDDLTVVIAGWPRREFDANRGDVEGNYLRMFEMAPSFAERIRGATRE